MGIRAPAVVRWLLLHAWAGGRRLDDLEGKPDLVGVGLAPLQILFRSSCEHRAAADGRLEQRRRFVGMNPLRHTKAWTRSENSGARSAHQ
eukprot:scaffold5681_cov30-Tisochrysis_lutea.AAC.3